MPWRGEAADRPGTDEVPPESETGVAAEHPISKSCSVTEWTPEHPGTGAASPAPVSYSGGHVSSPWL